jgi:hypothetical protein
MYCDLINRHGSRSTVYENQSLVIFIKYVMEEIMLIRVLKNLYYLPSQFMKSVLF